MNTVSFLRRISIAILLVGISLTFLSCKDSNSTQLNLATDVHSANETPTIPDNVSIVSPSPFVPSPTWTKVPTLPYFEARVQIINLLETNGGCELPCWWGIIPNSSSYHDTIEFFGVFESVASKRWEDEIHDHLDLIIEPPGLHMHIEYQNISDSIGTILVKTEMREILESGYEYDYNSPEYFDLMHNYTLEAILKKYGQPSRVLIKSFAPSPYWFLSQTLLYYADDGILMEYRSENSLTLSSDGQDLVLTCPSEGYITLRLFDPQEVITLDQLLEPYEKLSRYLDIQDATNMTVQDFYEKYQNYGCDEGLITPAELWPSEFN